MPAEIAHSIRCRRSLADNIAEDLRRRIERGQYPVGACLPGRRALASEYSVAPINVQKAVNELIEDGFLRAENGRGTFVVRSSALPKDRLGVIGIVTYVYPSWKGPGPRVEKASSIIQSLERSIALSGGSSVYFNRYRADGKHAAPREAIARVRDMGAESVVFVLDQDHEDFQTVGQRGADEIPMISILWDECWLPMPHLYYDSVDAGRSAARHLIDRGSRRLVYFSSGVSSWSERRAVGATEVVRASGVDCSIVIRQQIARHIPNALVEVDYETEALAYARQVLADGLEFDGAIAANDRMAIQFAAAAAERGMHAGKDYALIGFDNDDEARSANLTTMQPPWTQMGQEAAGLLQGIMAGDEPRSVAFRSHLIIRQSSKFQKK